MEQKPVSPQTTQQPAAPQQKSTSPQKDSKSYVVIALFVLVGFVVGKLAFDYLLPMVSKQFAASKNTKTTKTGAKSTEKKSGKPAARKSSKSGKAAVKAEPIDLKNAVTLTPSGEHEVKTPIAKTKQGVPDFMLNGIFFADNTDHGTALINDRIVQVGDNIEGAVVIAITMEGVELDYNGKTIRLVNR
ncbi:MAG TPA: type II secretion system protein N [Candidatus Omnitrophota bacterium]|nr:type II secretion system protein N [Candidatus Omnitrophota bacterium]HRZ14874.1 type II secretion system protein N [Candidatus Omnitrophota bacterium]